MKTLIYNGHKIEVKLWWTEKVFYDGKLMTSRFTVFGGTHIFQVEEEGETINYEVETYEGFPIGGMKVRRNGILIYSDK
jgi:hypothetical protein